MCDLIESKGTGHPGHQLVVIMEENPHTHSKLFLPGYVKLLILSIFKTKYVLYWTPFRRQTPYFRGVDGSGKSVRA